jgi:RNA polymerase sigma-70 factor (ECF subfamily)
VDQLKSSGVLSNYHLLSATRADFLRRLGRYGEAIVEYEASLRLVSADVERRYLEDRLAEMRLLLKA